MAWIAVGVSAFSTFVMYLATIRNFNWRGRSLLGWPCCLFLLKHMLPDGHPFEFMYKGLPRNEAFPRLLWPCLDTIVSVGLNLASIVIAAVLSANGVLENKNSEMAFFLSCLGSTFLVHLVFLAIPEIQNDLCFKKLMRGTGGIDIPQIRAEIERKWPGFYQTGK